MAKSVKEAIAMEKKATIDSVWIDNDWKKQNDLSVVEQKDKLGFDKQ